MTVLDKFLANPSVLAAMWLGSSLAIDVEARTKFTAPLLTRRAAFSVGRVVFQAQHRLEWLLLAATVAATVRAPAAPMSAPGLSLSTHGALAVACGAFAAQSLAIGPILFKRAKAEEAGKPLPKSNVHLIYVVVEVVKLMALAGAI